MRRVIDRLADHAAYIPIALVALLALGAALSRSCRPAKANHHESGYAAMRAARYDEAIREFSAALRDVPWDVSSRFGLGWAYQSKGMLPESIREYEAASPELLEKTHITYHNLGVAYQNQGRPEEAEAAYLRSIGVNPTAMNSLQNVVLIYEQTKRPRRILDVLRWMELSKGAAGSASFFANAGGYAERAGDRETAARYYREALRLDPANAQAQSRLKALR